jgi:hypothetical protein
MEEMIEGLHVGHVFCLFHNGDMPDWKTRLSSRLFAERVMPKLRDMWPQWRDDGRWWPRPMDDRLRPEAAMGKDRVWPEHRSAVAGADGGKARKGEGESTRHAPGPREVVR